MRHVCDSSDPASGLFRFLDGIIGVSSGQQKNETLLQIHWKVNMLAMSGPSHRIAHFSCSRLVVGWSGGLHSTKDLVYLAGSLLVLLVVGTRLMERLGRDGCVAGAAFRSWRSGYEPLKHSENSLGLVCPLQS